MQSKVGVDPKLKSKKRDEVFEIELDQIEKEAADFQNLN